MCELSFNLFRYERSWERLLTSPVTAPEGPRPSAEPWKHWLEASGVFAALCKFFPCSFPIALSDFQPPAIPVSGISWGEVVSCDGLCIHSVMGASNHWGIGLMHLFHLWLGLNLNLFLQRNNKTLNYYVSNLLNNCYFMNNNWDQ